MVPSRPLSSAMHLGLSSLQKTVAATELTMEGTSPVRSGVPWERVRNGDSEGTPSTPNRGGAEGSIGHSVRVRA